MAVQSLLWDTCVIYRWFTGVPEDYVDHIGAFLKDAEEKKVDLYISTITYAEIAPSRMGKSGLTPFQILASMSKSLIVVDTSPDIMSMAGHLRDQSYRQLDGPDEKASSRILSLGDSIHLATCIALQEEFGVQNLTLHTFDEGKRKDSEIGKRTVPMLGFQNWCRDCASDDLVEKAIQLNRAKPVHYSLPLPRARQMGSSDHDLK